MSICCMRSPRTDRTCPAPTLHRLDPRTTREDYALGREIPYLGSHIIAIVRRQLPQRWTARFNTMSALIEVSTDSPRHTGAFERPSGWIDVGTNQERGRRDTKKRYDKSKNDIWLQG